MNVPTDVLSRYTASGVCLLTIATGLYCGVGGAWVEVKQIGAFAAEPLRYVGRS